MDVIRSPQIGFMCNDIDAMVKFYIDGLGLPLHRGRVDVEALNRFYYTVKCGDTILKLWSYNVEPDSAYAPPKGLSGRMDQVGFRYLTILSSSDLEEVADRIEALGFELFERPRASMTGYPGDIMFTQDPDGNWLEVIRLHDPQWDPYA